jgi:hypothetical protein
MHFSLLVFHAVAMDLHDCDVDVLVAQHLLAHLEHVHVVTAALVALDAT